MSYDALVIDGALAARGIELEFARDAFARYALEGASVVSF